MNRFSLWKLVCKRVYTLTLKKKIFLKFKYVQGLILTAKLFIKLMGSVLRMVNKEMSR